MLTMCFMLCVVSGGFLHAGFRAGDDEGAVEFRLFYDGDTIASVHLFISGM